MKNLFILFLSVSLFFLVGCGDDDDDDTTTGDDDNVQELSSTPEIKEFSVDCVEDENGIKYLKISLTVVDKEGDYDKALFTWTQAENPAPPEFELEIGQKDAGEQDIVFDDYMLASAGNGDAVLQVVVTDKEGNSSAPATGGLCICIAGSHC